MVSGQIGHVNQTGHLSYTICYRTCVRAGTAKINLETLATDVNNKFQYGLSKALPSHPVIYILLANYVHALINTPGIYRCSNACRIGIDRALVYTIFVIKPGGAR